MTHEEQEQINEIFLGKEDEETHFVPTPKTKEDVERIKVTIDFKNGKSTFFSTPDVDYIPLGIERCLRESGYQGTKEEQREALDKLRNKTL